MSVPAAFLAASLALPANAGAAQQPPVFRAGVESVYVDVFVSRGGKPVEGLQASHFELEDDGRRQRVELVAVESLPLTTVLVFDTSESVRGAKLAALQAAAEAFIDGLRARDEVSLYTFSHEVRRLSPPVADKAAIRGALARLRAEGATAVWDALSAALTTLPTASRSLVVLFSDGADNQSWLDATRVHAQAARSNALVQVVGLSPTLDDDAGGRTFGFAFPGPGMGGGERPPEPAHVGDLRRVAEVTGGRYWQADSSARLGDAFRAIIEAMNTRYVLRYDPGPDAKPGYHRIEVKLKGARGDVRARQGYWRPARGGSGSRPAMGGPGAR